MDKNEAIRRLVFIKYLYDSGVDQSKKPAPFSWLSLLIFHDTVELFLVLIAEYLDQSEKALRELSFTKYWDIIDPLLKQHRKNSLTQRISMERLNDARNAFKHRGTTPSDDTITSAKINVGNFLAENARLVLDVELSDVSLIDFVYFKGAQNSLKDAAKLMEQKRPEEAIDKIALALRQLIDDYIDRKRLLYGRSMFTFSTFSGCSISEDNLSEVESVFDEVQDALEGLEEPLRLLALGLDYRKYVKFDLLTSRSISRDKVEGYKVRRLERKIDSELTEEDIKFCTNFVIECSIALKQFDFELKPKKPKTIADMK
ncbi:MAG: hypothetical protein M1540_02855 [Candidatus Bathyarchaeota archaeon]|nr:hypothetical protein [Candidatus Bathyarchaeota archaeon]